MLNKALRLIRVYHDMKQAELAVSLGISKSYISEIEKGTKTPTIDLINKYADTFDIPASSILFFSENVGKPFSATSARQAQQFVAGKIIKLLQFIESKAGSAHAE